jgi:hypothetical protein
MIAFNISNSATINLVFLVGGLVGVALTGILCYHLRKGFAHITRIFDLLLHPFFSMLSLRAHTSLYDSTALDSHLDQWQPIY